MRGPAACSTAWHSGRPCRGRWLWLLSGTRRWLLRGGPFRGRQCRDCSEFPDPRLRRPSRRVPRGILQRLLSAGRTQRLLRRAPWTILPVSQPEWLVRARQGQAASVRPCPTDQSLSPDPPGNLRKRMRFHSTARPREPVPWVRAFPEACSLRALPSSGKSAPAPTSRGQALRVPARSPTRIPVRVRTRVLGVEAWARLPAAIPGRAPAPRPPLRRVPAAAERLIPRPAAIPHAEQRFPPPPAYSARLEHLLAERAVLRKSPPAGWSSLPDCPRQRAP